MAPTPNAWARPSRSRAPRTQPSRWGPRGASHAGRAAGNRRSGLVPPVRGGTSGDLRGSLVGTEDPPGEAPAERAVLRSPALLVRLGVLLVGELGADLAERELQ